MATSKEEIGISTTDMGGIYFLPKSSPFLEFDYMATNFDFSLELKKKKLKAIFYFEIFFPNYADFMMFIEVDLGPNHLFYLDEIFLDNMITDIYSTAFNGFKMMCKSEGIKLPKVGIDTDFPEGVVKNIIERAPKMIKFLEENVMINDESAFTISAANSRDMVLQITMLLLDLVLLNSPFYDRIYNRDLLEEKTGIPFSDYLKIRGMCTKETTKKMSFSVLQAMRLIQLFDCAAQFVLHPVYERVSEVIEAAGLSPENMKTYLAEIDRFNSEIESMIEGYTAAKPYPLKLKDWASEIR